MRRISKNLLFVLGFFFAFSSISAQNLAEIPVPLDPMVRTGTLQNGLTYYIRYNEEPKDRASFYIVQNVGALLEEDHQNGLAHFLEHMAFNGTENFEGKGILNTLERHGVAFGRNINAYTSFNETVYNISDVPVNRPGILDTCLLILYDWSNGLLLTDEEIELERGVILEEWRTRRNSNIRMRDQWFPVLFEGSMYAVRDIIGDTTVIKYHDPEVLRQFYHDWYRTDLQAIIMVGQFDVDEMEEKVIELFSEIPAVENALERPFFEIPKREGTAFVVATDREATQTSITIYIPRRNRDMQKKTLEDLRSGYIRSLYNSMTSARIQELLQQGTPPFINGYTQAGGFMRGYDSYVIGVTANPGEAEKAVEAIMVETERVLRYGFTENELARAKSNILTNLESRYNDRGKIRNDVFARQLQNHYLINAVVPGIEFEYEFANQVIPGITVEEVSAIAREWIREDNRTIVVTGPDNIEHIAETSAFSIMDGVKLAEISPYEDRLLAESLIEKELPGSSIEQTVILEDFDAVEWTLSNGVRVVFRHADYEKDNVLLSAYSPGGSSVKGNDFVPSITLFNELITSYGVGDFDAVSLQQMLSGKRVSVRPMVYDFSETISGNAAPRDFETMMQLVYLYFEQPRFDEEAHNALMSRYVSFVANMQNEPRKIMSDSITLLLSDFHPRVRNLDVSLINEVCFEQIRAIYQDRIHDASDFVFFIVGNMDEEVVRLMSKQYLGSLTGTGREETWVDHGVRFPQGQQKKQIEIPLEIPKANVNVFYSREMDYAPENLMFMRVLRGILNLRYIETIREDEGGTYGVSVGWTMNRKPVQTGGIQMRFETDPERVDHLKPILYREIEKIIAEGPTQDDFQKTIENILKDREQARRHNSFWLNSLYNFYREGVNHADEENFEEIARNMTLEDIHQFVIEFFNEADLMDILFLPQAEIVSAN
ncbi:M16 family metallopeptidase [Alkalitalea saponilacus]|uniref:Zinc protease n=1 Tax=Alkalitalea saponilacus TaxID=889453 RepID=A0A1T5CC49_9BACT|nr:insulinase family protein [Alkalitalea saponilacus]ASB49811.1 peptidase M16 [Alkalitalea saponilacus]SKB57142.1 zinc protease [Alkalitalea saponilacus]